MSRYKIEIEYDGGSFYGWQEQEELPTIQSSIQKAIQQFCGEVVVVHGAGRTDAGVHALKQVAHFDIDKVTTAKDVQSALNHFLQYSKIAILSAEEVENTFHARFSAKNRSYIYKIINRRQHLTHDKGFAWHVVEQLNIEAMNCGAKHLIGRHDFESFRSAQCQARSSLKSIDSLRVERHNNRVELFITARSFLHNQVRIIVGTLYKIGRGSWEPDKILEILALKSRSAAGRTAPAHGLYLSDVTY